MFQACIKVFCTVHKITEVTDLNGYKGGIHLWTDTETKPCKHLAVLWKWNRSHLHLHTSGKFISFLAVKKHTMCCFLPVTSWKLAVVQLQLRKENYKFHLRSPALPYRNQLPSLPSICLWQTTQALSSPISDRHQCYTPSHSLIMAWRDPSEFRMKGRALPSVRYSLDFKDDWPENGGRTLWITRHFLSEWSWARDLGLGLREFGSQTLPVWVGLGTRLYVRMRTR